MTSIRCKGRHRNPAFADIPRDRPRVGIVTTLEPYWAANTPFIREYLGELDIPVTVASARELGHAVDVLCATGGSAALRAVLTDADRRNWNLQNALPELKRRGNPSGETTGSARLAALREITDTRPAHADEAGLRTLLAELGPMRDVLAHADVERKAR